MVTDLTTDALAEECLQARREIRVMAREARRRAHFAAADWANASEYVIRGVILEDS